MGFKINPEFVAAAKKLMQAQENYTIAKNGGNEAEMRAAEEAFHDAEAVYCNLPGMISGSEPKEAVQAQIDALMGKVSIFYQ